MDIIYTIPEDKLAPYLSEDEDTGGKAGWLSMDELNSLAEPTTVKRAELKSHSGCNKDVCIDVVGKSTHVDSWSTSAFGNVGCLYAWFYTDGKIYKRSKHICPEHAGPGVYYSLGLANKSFSDGTKLCNKWFDTVGTPPKPTGKRLPGNPCAEIIKK
ncbi:hypothetical protein ACIA6D_46055 [Streptomyces cacaoi]|uniref:hypothetical protein n=1 Tax=Streptomyces cacaoi TaxID=1898 RepID=UPI003749961A